MAKGNKAGHRRFGNIRRLPSGRYQGSYQGPDGQRRNLPDTFERKADADRALTLVEAQITMGSWTDPERGKVKLADYAATWITQRPKLRPRTIDTYRWLLSKHIEPHLGGVAIGKLSTSMIREWRADLLGNGVSVSVAAKAYRLLRAVLMTATDEDGILQRNPCRIRGAGDEDTPERPVLTVAQVFALADLVGRRPVGNIRKLPAGGYRLRFARHGEMRTFPEIYATRTEADRALCELADSGRADYRNDRRYAALVLLATFASLRWGEITALRRCDLDLDAGSVRVRAAYIERSTGEMLLGPPKSEAGRRVVGVPDAIIPAVRDHLAVYVQDDPGALIFPGAKGGPLRRGNFNRMSAWPHAVRSLGVTGLHFHDLRHTGNTFAGESGVGLRDLMARMGHDSERAALIYQHKARGADERITSAIDAHVQAERHSRDDDEDGEAGVLVPAG
jgi:integrase